MAQKTKDAKKGGKKKKSKRKRNKTVAQQ